MMKKAKPMMMKSTMKAAMYPAKKFAGKGTRGRLNTAAEKMFFGRKAI